MHDLGGRVVANGTLVAFQTTDKLFDGTTASLHDDAPGRLASLVKLAGQINPSGLIVTVRDSGDADLARRRAVAIRAWLSDTGQIRLPIRIGDSNAADAPAIGVLILR